MSIQPSTKSTCSGASTWLLLFYAPDLTCQFTKLLMPTGATLAAAVAVGTLMGPVQVGARVLEIGLLRRMHPLLSAHLPCRP